MSGQLIAELTLSLSTNYHFSTIFLCLMTGKNALSPKKVVCSLYIFRKMGNIKMKVNNFKKLLFLFNFASLIRYINKNNP